MATTTTLGSTVRNNSGKIFNANNIAGTAFRGLTQLVNTQGTAIAQRMTTQYPGASHVRPCFVGGAVAITSILQSSSTGYTKITKTSHGLSVGDIIVVYAADVAHYNQTHVVTVVLSSSTIQTNVTYTADTSSAHGSYKPLSRNFNKLVARDFIGMIIGDSIAGTSDSTLRMGGEFNRTPMAQATGYNQNNITSWNYVTGAATKGGSAGTHIYYHDIGANNDSLQTEGLPTRAIPGELVYMKGSLTPVQADYPAKTM